MAPSDTTSVKPDPRSPPGGARAARAAMRPPRNPLRDSVASGKMPIIQELHLTVRDRVGYQRLRHRYLSDSAAVPSLTFLGQYLRQLDAGSGDLTSEERDLAAKLQGYADLLNSGKTDLIALDDGARGQDSLDNAVAAELLTGLGVDPAQLMANVVARNRKAEQIRQRLIRFADIGLRNVLLLTGDLPTDRSKPAWFPLDSLGMCELAREMLVEGALPEDFLIAAAGHPNADADPDGLRTLQKALAGAKVIITQVILSIEPFSRWMASLRTLGVLDMVHVFAGIIPITSCRQLQILSDIPGIRVPQSLAEEFSAIEERITSAARTGGHPETWIKQRRTREGARLTRSLFQQVRKIPEVSGFYLGCVRSFNAHLELLKETPLLRDHPRVLQKGARLTGLERQRTLAQLPVIEAYLDRMSREARGRRRSVLRRLMRWAARSLWAQRVMKVIEWPKVPVFGCRGCDRCDLSADALVCPRGCAKQMSHGPCGALRADGGRVLCEDTTRECTWARIHTRRERFGVPMKDRLEIREAPAHGFYEGKTYSAFLPVFAGRKPGPNWSLAYRAPWAGLMSCLRDDYKLKADESPLELSTLVASKAPQIRRILEDNPQADREGLWVKALSLVGAPQAIHLIESRLVQLGLPAEGTFSELSIREQFQVAEALPVVRRRVADAGGPSSVSPLGRCDKLLAVVGEGKALRRALRRELANGLIQHTASLGVRVTYTDVLLETKHVELFLQALTILKEELQLAPHRRATDSTQLAVHFNRIHYKHHYRAPVAIRRYHSPDDRARNRTEFVVDLRQFGSADRFRANLRAALAQVADGGPECRDAIALESFTNESRGVCWSFNNAYWRRLRDFEEATGVHYDASIGGSTDHNQDYVRSTARAYFDRLCDRGLRDERFYIVEIGVASTHRARMFLSELHRIGSMTGTDYYDRTTYVLADYSEEILERSKADLEREHPYVEAVKFDAAHPAQALAPYQGRVMQVHLCNVYDNLPADKVAWVDGRFYGIEGRSYLPREVMASLLSRHDFKDEDAFALEERLASLATSGDQGVEALLEWASERLTELGSPPLAYVGFWMDLFSALRMEERYVTLDRTNWHSLASIARLEDVGKLVDRLFPTRRNVRVHLNQKALEGFVELLGVLHPYGTLEVVDLFVQRVAEYYDRFKGPAKYDGSTVNWLNGPLFREVGEQLGFSVQFYSFKPFDPKSASVIMVAAPKSA